MSNHPDDLSTRHDRQYESMANADTVFSTDEPSGAFVDPAGPTGPQSGRHSESFLGHLLAGRYNCLQMLGSGGMGAVYLARDHELDELIAVKMLHDSVASSPDAIEFLRHEVRLARRVTHHNVARIFELGEHHGRRFLTMEYIDGEPLTALIERSGRIPLNRAGELLRDICSGLTAVHNAGIVHRDIKPDNIMVARGDRIVLSDFGIARAARSSSQTTLSTARAGTPAYMSPEQLVGETVTTLSDVYSLGVVAFEMLTGSLPWKLLPRTSDRLTAPPPDPRTVAPDLPDAIVRLLGRTLALRREERLASPAAFAYELTNAITNLSYRSHPNAPLTLTPTAHAKSGKLSLAVLPFRNRGSAENDYLASGFTEDLIDCLSGVAQLRVLSRGATARFADDSREAHDIGRELNVEIVIEGSLQQVGNMVQIKARAIESAEGVQRWSKRFRVPQEELLVTSDEVAEALAKALAPESSKADDGAPSLRQSALPNAEAMELYLRARESYRRFEDTREAVALFEEALLQAPNSPLVHAGYSMALMRAWMLGSMSSDDPKHASYRYAERARAAAQRASALAPNLGEPRMAFAMLALHEGDPVTAVREFRATIALAPSMASAHSFLGELLAEMARIPDAMRRLQAADVLDPSSAHANHVRRRVAVLTGDFEMFDKLAYNHDATTPFGWYWRGRYSAYRDDLDLLADTRERVRELPEDERGTRDLIVKVLSGYLGEIPGRDIYDELIGFGRMGNTSHRGKANRFQMVAELAGFLGDDDVALEQIAKAVDIGFMDLIWLQRCPLLKSVREQPRYTELHARVQERAFAAYDALFA